MILSGKECCELPMPRHEALEALEDLRSSELSDRFVNDSNSDSKDEGGDVGAWQL